MSLVQEREQAFMDAMAVLDDPVLQHEYVLSFARGLDELPEAERISERLLRGCSAQAWVAVERTDEGCVHLQGWSDALIVRGFLGLISSMTEGVSQEELARWEPAFLQESVLGRQLLSSRKRGLASLIDRMKSTRHFSS